MSLGRRSRTGGNRDRLLDGEVAARFLGAVLAQALRRDLMSDEHFTVDGTLIAAWAAHKSFRPKDGGRMSLPGRSVQACPKSTARSVPKRRIHPPQNSTTACTATETATTHTFLLCTP